MQLSAVLSHSMQTVISIVLHNIVKPNIICLSLNEFEQVYAWGSSQYGQLGVGTTGYCAEPRLVERLYGQSVVSVVAGQYHSLALTADGR